MHPDDDTSFRQRHAGTIMLALAAALVVVLIASCESSILTHLAGSVAAGLAR